MKQRYPITGILLIDSPAPLNHQPLSSAIIDSVVPQSNPGNKNALAIRRQFELNTALLTNFGPQRGNYPNIVLLRSSEGYDAKGLNCKKNAWLEDRSDPRTAVGGWEEIVAGEVKVLDVPGNHFEVFEKANVSFGPGNQLRG